MTNAEIIDFNRRADEAPYQGVKRVAGLMNITVNAAYMWPEVLGGRYWRYQAAFEVLTGGALKANLAEREMPTPARGDGTNRDVRGPSRTYAQPSGEALRVAAPRDAAARIFAMSRQPSTLPSCAPRPVDFTHVVEHLRERGVSQRELGAAVGVNESTVSRWASGVQEPRWKHGDALLRLSSMLGGEPAAPQSPRNECGVAHLRAPRVGDFLRQRTSGRD